MEMNQKTIAIAVVAILVIAGVAAVIIINPFQQKSEEKGLYALHATILDIDMGGMTNTPKMAETIEYMYKEVYGDLTDSAKKLTLADAKKDTKFWDTYANYESISFIGLDGSVTYTSAVEEGTDQLEIPNAADSMIFSYTAYAMTYYYLMCLKYNVEPFSDAAKNNTSLVAECKSTILAGLSKATVSDSTPELVYYFSDNYVELGGSLAKFDKEKLASAIHAASIDGKEVMLAGSGSLNAGDFTTYKDMIEEQGGFGIVFSSAKGTIDTFSAIEQTANIFGLEDYADDLIEDMQLRIYKCYYSAIEKNQEKSHKAYFESSSGKSASKTSSGCNLAKFLGWDVTLFTGAEIDTETLLTEKPDIMMYYTNDTRTMDEKMRATS